MSGSLAAYLREVAQTMKRGDAREESFYPALERLLEELGPELGHPSLEVTTLPKKTEAGNPDFRVWDGRARIIGYVEAKKPGENLDAVAQSEQLERYRNTFPNVILTDFFTFILFRDGVEVARATLAQLPPARLGRVPPLHDEEGFLSLLRHFFDYSLPEKIGARPLAERLARLTRFLRDQVIATELARGKESPLYGFLDVFKKTLIADLKAGQFADLFAQTLTYGMFAARIRAREEFNRKLAYDYIPHTLGVLREVFRYISLADLPRHLEVTLDDIAAVLQAADVAAILEEYQKTHHSTDPIVHFYETFLAEYDPGLRERRGVYYTPEPVVRYIVESVHHLLKTRFDAPLGLADAERPVTLLDPAAGTLTFPAMAVERAAAEYRGTWGDAGIKDLIKHHVLPRFFAFELMMAPYAVGHLKIGLVLEALGYELAEDERFNLFLTNTLEMETLPGSADPILSALSVESRLAGEVKSEKPILVILGNPPYSGHSANKNDWTESLLKEDHPGAPSYYKVDGKPLGEKNPKWLQDDYVKFLRFAQWKIARHGEGVVAMITNHSYLDNPTFRGMRQSLLETFDEIYILNLHGNSKKKEKAPDGGPDENVFDIQQGVAIGLFVKRGEAGEKKVYYADLWGRRAEKYRWLSEHALENTPFEPLHPVSPFYFFVPRNTEGIEHYRQWSRVDELLPESSVGIVTARDKLTIASSKEELLNRVRTFAELEEELAREAFKLGRDVRDWKVRWAQDDIKKQPISEALAAPILYRPFDVRWTYYTGRSRGFICYPREEVMRHMLAGPNLALLVSRQVKAGKSWQHSFVTKHITESSAVSNKTSEIGSHYPIYFYEEPAADLFGQEPLPRLNASSAASLYLDYLVHLAWRAWRTPLGHLVELKPGHYFGLLGVEVSDPEEARKRLAAGKMGFSELQGFEQEKVSWLQRLPELLSSPDRVLLDTRQPKTWLYVRKTPDGQSLAARLREVGGGRFEVASLGVCSEKSLDDERYEVQWTPAGPSRPAGSTGLGGGEAPSPGSSGNRYSTRWVTRRPNLEAGAWRGLMGKLGLEVSPEDFLAYVYAVLYTPAYREKYAEFLRVDFPRVPWPQDAGTFSAFAERGRRLIELHTLEAADLVPPSARFFGEGSGLVEKPRYDESAGRVYVNKAQYFEPVSPEAWNYRIGGYQVLEKWLKDRKGMALDDPKTYMKIVTAIEKTLEVQRELDELWPVLEAEAVSRA
ncbi:type ISP restriction/modification enzyme [Oceanithermus sp.]